MWRKVKETLHKADILTLISTGTLAILLTFDDKASEFDLFPHNELVPSG
jgi:ABC-type uncharacterized transport system YnjBCD substrate-binding protein